MKERERKRRPNKMVIGRNGKRALAFAMAVLLCLQLVVTDDLFAATAHAATFESITDPVFRAYIMAVVGKDDPSGKITSSDISKVTSIDVTPENIYETTGLTDSIESLEGIGIFQKLKTLNCSGQSHLTALPSAVSSGSELKSLRELYCADCALTEIKMGICKKVTILDCSGNPSITSLDLRDSVTSTSQTALAKAVAAGTKSEQGNKTIYHYQDDSKNYILTTDQGVNLKYYCIMILNKNSNNGSYVFRYVRGEQEVSASVSSASLLSGTSVTLEATPDDQYFFTGWTRPRVEADGLGDEDILISKSNPYTVVVNNDMNITANFEEKSSISFDANGGNGSMDSLYFIPGETVVMPTNGFTAPAGQAFYGWQIKFSNDETVNAAEGEGVTASLNGVAKPVWRTAYAISFETNNANATGSMASDQALEGTSYILPECTFGAPTGYYFKEWKAEGTNQTFQPGEAWEEVTGPVTFIAVFEKTKHKVTISVDPDGSGSVTGAGTYEYGTSVTVTAEAEEHYDFQGWKEGNTVVSENESYTFTVTAARNLVAAFQPEKYNISFDYSCGGTVTGSMDGALVTYGSVYTVPECGFTAEGYQFTYYVCGNDTYKPGDKIAVQESMILCAHIEPLYTVTYWPGQAENGDSASGSSYSESVVKYEFIEFPEPTAFTAPKGHSFAGWIVCATNGNQIDTNTYKPGDKCVIPNEDVFVKATWEANLYRVTVVASPAAGGTVTGGGNYRYGNKISLKAFPNTGYEFLYWKIGNDIVSYYANDDYLTVTGDMTVVGVFEKKTQSITFTTDGTTGATGSMASQTVTYGDTFTLPKCGFTTPEGFRFMGYQCGTDTYMPGESLTIYENKNFIACYARLYEIVFEAPSAGGNDPSGSMDSFVGIAWEEFTLPECGFTAPEGYEFSYWEVTGVGSKQPGDVIDMGATGRVVSAKWEAKTYPISVTASPAEGGTLTGITEGTYGVNYSVYAYANEGYEFVGWKVGNQIVSDINRYDIFVTGPTTVVAVFARAKRIVKFWHDGYAQGEMENVEAHYWDEYTLPECGFTPNAGYGFTGWLYGADQNVYQPGEKATIKGHMSYVTFTAQYDLLPDTVTIDATNFPDETFRNYVLEKFDTDESKALSPYEIAQATSISLVDKGVLNLKGIEHFTELDYLSIGGNVGIQFDLSKNTKLRTLYCSHSGLTSLDVSKNTELEILTCCGEDDGKLSSINLSGLTKLKQLDLSQNNFTTLNVSGCTALEDLTVSYNPLQTLDVSKNTALTNLTCYSTNLAAIDVSKNTALTELSISSNPNLTALDLSKNTALEILRADSNENLQTINVSNCLALKNLSACSLPLLKAIDVSKNTALQNLYLTNDSGLTTLDLTKNTALIKVSLTSSTSLRDVLFGNHPNLTDLNMSGVPVKSLDLSGMPMLRMLNCLDSALVELDVSQNTHLVNFYCSACRQLVKLTVGNKPELTFLNCNSDNALTYLDVSGATALEYLYASECSLSGIELGTNSQLRYVNCTRNHIAKLDVSGCSTLKSEGTIYADDDTVICTEAPKKYTVTLGVNTTAGGTVQGAGAWIEGATATVRAFPADGYALKNWTEGNTVVSTEEIYQFEVTGNRTLKANFVKGYTVSFDGNGAAGFISDKHVKENEVITLPAYNGFQAPRHKKFDGWDLGKPGDTLTITKNTVVKAIWVDDTATLTFDANGGSGTMEDVVTWRYEDYEVPECTFKAPEGYEFDYWYVKASDARLQPGEGFYVWGDRTITAVWKEATGFKLAGANMNLGNALAMNFYIKKSDIDTSKEYYVEIKKSYVGGTTAVRQIPMSKWSSYNENLYKVVFNGIAAKEMNDRITVRVYEKDGTAVSQLWVDSVVDYVKRALDKQQPYVQTAMVDMLNYGAAAQKALDYDKNNLANSWLSATQKAYASEAATGTNAQKKILNYQGCNLNLGSNLCMNMYFTNLDPTKYNTMYAVLTYKNHNGKESSIKVDGSKFMKYSDTLTNVRVEVLAVAEVNSVVECKVYSKSGNNLLGHGIDSIGGYIARQTKTNEVFDAIMKFSVSAYKCFHPNQN